MLHTWEEIKKAKEDFIQNAKNKINFKKNDCVEVIEKGNKARVGFINFDENKGEAYIKININRHRGIGWISTRDGKTVFYESEINQIKKIDNPVNMDRIEELKYELEMLDDKPLTVSSRREKEIELKKQIKEEQLKCIHI